MKFLKWLLETIIVDPLIMLFVWNVIIVPMFAVSRTDFGVCFIISAIINVLYGAYKIGNNN